MDFVYLVGLAAAALTSFGFIPQIILGYKSKHMKDVSLLMSLMLLSGMGLWLTYGILRNDIVIILANVVAVFLLGTIIVMKFYYNK
jgi:MtN3 and saliva related transmembrane protein